MRLVTTAEMRTLEAAAEAAGISTAQLMENAGLGVAQEVWMLLGTLEDRRILVLAGPGNNGGDGLVAARHLHDWGAEVGVYLLRHRPTDDPLLTALRERNVTVVAADDDPTFATLDEFLSVAEVIVDALLGTGLSRPIQGPLAEVLQRVRRARERPVRPRLVAVDLPTGVDPDTGRADPLAVAADLTVALGEAKVGLYVGQGAGLAGRVQVVEIGIPATAKLPAGIELLDRTWVKRHLPARPADANKGTFGRVLVLAGSQFYVGAAALAAAGAYRVGAGLVTLAVPRSIQAMVAARLAEATYLPLDEQDGALAPSVAPRVHDTLKGYDVLLAGCGLSTAAAEAVRAVLFGIGDMDLRGVVIDADGLNALVGVDGWAERLPARAVLTPHPGEMARLTGWTVQQIQADRLAVARTFAQRWRVVVVLKGANTVVAAPDGRMWLSPFANPALATAGTGDVLAGAVAGLIGQGMDPAEAAACAVFLHGLAGDTVRGELGPAGVVASDLLPELPRAIKSLVEPAPLTAPGGGLFGTGLGGLPGLGGVAGLGLAGSQGLGALGGPPTGSP